ncbi:kinase-like domain-containing protein [Aspergillus pseudoustus]|uniref:EKC/KEOPS complex subunit BUD32 n=1 Tax=Aspergillus pseudoustus TaxID=1810923 RepID=A0ABR4J255_9EURO
MPPVQYKFVDEVERLDFYVPGGYHPVKLGDIFCAGRYTIVHKLGFGRSATTWLAEDTQEQRLADSDLPGKALIQNLFDSFTISGPNGIHRCLVTDAARLNLNELKEYPYHRLLPLSAARAIAAQLVLGVQFIHSQGVVHGDLRLSNILLKLPTDMQDMTLEQLRAKTGEQSKQLVIREDGAALGLGDLPELIVPIWLGTDGDKVTIGDSPILIVDFGETFDPNKTKQYTARTPRQFSPPESRFADAGGSDDPLTFPGDMWTLACAMWDILGSGPPFESLAVSLDEVTMEHVELLGRLPDRWWVEWKERRNWFNEDGSKKVMEELRQRYGNTHRYWDTRKHGLGMFSAEEEKAFRAMMSLMLVLEPGKRATIDEVVQCEWMQRWGLSEWRKIQDVVNRAEGV